ncbi:MAG: MBL fold metallo-hydrolase [Nocardiopsaceae bacterium]|nr:MBL fold metallo-hydrolase [Nocardiopsaceae bacterium]
MAARIERVWTPRVAEGDESGDAAEANAWLIGDEDEVIVIDPGEDASAILDAVGDREILAVICTHGHATHTATAMEVSEQGDYAPVALHRADKLHWRAAHPDDDPDIEMEDAGAFEVADARLEVLHTPGHTQGSVSLYCPDLGAVFTGDALLASGPAPHDGIFPDFPRQLTAIGEKLLELPAKTRVLPGHGEESLIGDAVKRFDGWVTAGPSAAGD